jgi:hypothetical protein
MGPETGNKTGTPILSAPHNPDNSKIPAAPAGRRPA